MRPCRGTLILLLATAILWGGCAQKGLLLDRHPAERVAVPWLLPDSTASMNPSFLVIGDEQMGRRAIEKFYKSDNWLTWWQLAVPFYQAYLLCNGISGGINYLRHVPDAGQDTWLMMRDVLYRDAQALGTDFILNTGDISSSNGAYPSHWERFLQGKKWEHPFLDEIAYVPTLGNHEWANDTLYAWPNYQAVFDVPRFYALEFEHAAILVLDSNRLVDQGGIIPDDEQDEIYRRWFVSGEGTSWLEQQLERFADKPHILLSLHHALVTYGWHEYDWDANRYGNDLAAKRVEIVRLLREHNVSVVFNGHEHIYQRIPTTMVGEPESARPTQFITSSAGGVPLRTPPSEKTVSRLRQRLLDDGIHPHQARIGGEYHYCHVEMDVDSLYVTTWQVDKEHDDHPVTAVDRVVVPSRTPRLAVD